MLHNNSVDTTEDLKVLFRAYNLIIKIITRGATIVETKTKDVKLPILHLCY